MADAKGDVGREVKHGDAAWMQPRRWDFTDGDPGGRRWGIDGVARKYEDGDNSFLNTKLTKYGRKKYLQRAERALADANTQLIPAYDRDITREQGKVPKGQTLLRKKDGDLSFANQKIKLTTKGPLSPEKKRKKARQAAERKERRRGIPKGQKYDPRFKYEAPDGLKDYESCKTTAIQGLWDETVNRLGDIEKRYNDILEEKKFFTDRKIRMYLNAGLRGCKRKYAPPYAQVDYDEEKTRKYTNWTLFVKMLRDGLKAKDPNWVKRFNKVRGVPADTNVNAQRKRGDIMSAARKLFSDLPDEAKEELKQKAKTLEPYRLRKKNNYEGVDMSDEVKQLLDDIKFVQDRKGDPPRDPPPSPEPFPRDSFDVDDDVDDDVPDDDGDGEDDPNNSNQLQEAQPLVPEVSNQEAQPLVPEVEMGSAPRPTPNVGARMRGDREVKRGFDPVERSEVKRKEREKENEDRRERLRQVAKQQREARDRRGDGKGPGGVTISQWTVDQ